MVALPNRRSRVTMAIRLTGVGVGLLALLCMPGSARAGKLSWLDEVVQEVVREARAGGGRPSAGATPRDRRRGRPAGCSSTRPTRGWRSLAKRSDDLARAGRRVEQPVRGAAPEPVRPPAAPRPRGRPHLLGPRAGREAAGRRDGRDRPAARPALPRPGRDDDPPARHRGALGRPRLRRRRGRGARQGRAGEPGRPPQDRPGRLGVLHRRRSCPTRRSWPPRACWPRSWPTPTSSSTTPARPPSTPSASSPGPASSSPAPSAAGRRAGSKPRSAQALAAHGLDFAVFRYLGMGLAGLVVVLATMVILGMPVGWMFRPLTWPLGCSLAAVRRAAEHRAASCYVSIGAELTCHSR